MATAVKHTSPTPPLEIPGIVLEGFVIPPLEVQQVTTKFWGVVGESRIRGKTGGRTLSIPIIIYDDVTPTTFDTALKLSVYIETTLNRNQVGELGQVEITSESNHAPFTKCTFEGFLLTNGIKKDYAGSLGGNYFAHGRLIFRQHA